MNKLETMKTGFVWKKSKNTEINASLLNNLYLQTCAGAGSAAALIT
jgi:hypothetical protein